MNKKIFFLILLLFIIFFDNYAFGIVVVPHYTHSYSSNCYSDLMETIHETKGEEVIEKKCLKKEYLFLNKGEEYCVIERVMNKKIYFRIKIITWLIALLPILLLCLLGYMFYREEI